MATVARIERDLLHNYKVRVPSLEFSTMGPEVQLSACKAYDKRNQRHTYRELVKYQDATRRAFEALPCPLPGV